jgi:hypothetical protein
MRTWIMEVEVTGRMKVKWEEVTGRMKMVS